MDIMKINEDRVTEYEETKSSTLYTLNVNGRHIFEGDESDPKVCAKKLTINGADTYFVKRNSGNGSLFNPNGLYVKGTENKFDNTRGRSEWLLKKVSKEKFDCYLKFLTTANEAWLQRAEREM